MPTISVIITVYNYEKFLAEAIESVLDQTYPPSQIIVVNDGSSDKSAAVAESFMPQVTVIHQSNQGISGAKNRGVKEAWGNYLTFIDADDIWVKDKLRDQMAVFEKDENVEAVFGHARQFYSPDIPDEIRAKIVIRKEILPAFLPSSMLIKRQAFMKVGLFSQQWTSAVDQEWYMRAVDIGLNTVLLPQILFLRRIHENNHGRRMKHHRKDRLYILKEAIERRRNENS